MSKQVKKELRLSI